MIAAVFVFPEPLWGFNHLYFLNGDTIAILGIVAIVVSVWFFKPPAAMTQFREGRNGLGEKLLYLLVVGASFLLISNTQPAHNLYGDAPMYTVRLHQAERYEMAGDWNLILSPNVFHPRVGERTTLNLAVQLGKFRGISPALALKDLGQQLGYAYLLVWALFSWVYHDRFARRILGFVIAGFGAMMFHFSGHAEIYAPPLLTFSLVLCAQLMHFKTGKLAWLIAAGIAFLIGLKFHITGWLLLPGLALSIAMAIRPGLGSAMDVKRFALTIWLPMLVLGLALYFGAFEGWDVTRDPKVRNDAMGRVVLPLTGGEAPLDRYNLLSPAHILDFGNLLLLVAPAALFLILSVGSGWKRTGPAGMVILTTLFLFSGGFFLINPLLSMPVDWDLYSLVTPAMLAAAAIAIHQLEGEKLRRIGALAMAITVLGSSAQLLESKRGPAAKRQELLASHCFKTYWIKSAQFMVNSALFLTNQPAEQNAVLTNYQTELEPWAAPHDVEYAHLIWRRAEIYRKHYRDHQEAGRLYVLALDYNPEHLPSFLGLMECQFVAGDYAGAFRQATVLARNDFPDKVKARQIAMHCAVMVQDAEAAGRYAGELLSIDPQHGLATKVSRSLRANVPMDSIASYFSAKR